MTTTWQPTGKFKINWDNFTEEYTSMLKIWWWLLYTLPEKEICEVLMFTNVFKKPVRLPFSIQINSTIKNKGVNNHHDG